MKSGFRHIEAKLLPGAVVIGVFAALIEDRSTLGGIAASVGLTTAAVLALGVLDRRPREPRLLVVLAILAVVAFIGARLIG